MKAWPPSWRSVVPNIPELKGSFRRAFDAGLLGLYLGAHRDQRAGGRTPRTRYRSPGPQYAVTSTSSWSQAAVQAAVSQLVRMTRSDPVAAPGAPGGPGGPASPFGPSGQGGPGGPGGPGSPFSPAGPATPASPFGPGLPWPQLANPRASAMRSAIFLDLSMTMLDPAARPCAVAGCGARHAVQSMRNAERPRRGFHRGQRSHGLLGGSGAFRERHRIMVRRAVWFPPST